jgi:GNAT superfamily N-acetyltransferase
LLGRSRFVNVPFRLHGGDPNWVPPLRLSVYDRLSPRHPATAHQRWALWTAHRGGKVVGRIGACVDSLFNEHWGEKWAWVGFFDSIDDPDVAASLFDVALDWSRRQGAKAAVGPANFTTNDELGLLVDGFDTPAAILTLENPRYYERLWVGSGWEQVMDLYGYQFRRETVALSDRQRQTLERLRERSKVRVRDMRTNEFEAEVGRFFDLYNAIWRHNWGFVPMPETEVRHLAKQLKQLLNPHWVFALERDGQPVAVCLCLPDANDLMRRKVRSGRLLPLGWMSLLFGVKHLKRARVVALGVRPDVQNLALGSLLYSEITNRLWADGVDVAEASWTLSTNHRINKQLEAMGGRRYKVWRLYKQELASS